MKLSFRLLLLMILSSVIFSCNHSASTANQKITIRDKGVNIAYTDSGKGDTTLLFVHGWAINKGYWSHQASYFSNKYRVIAIDLPGFGESGKNRSDWSTTAYSQDVDLVIARLNLRNVILIGHSMAGDIVLQSAIDNPKTVVGIIGIDNFKNVGQPQSPEAKKGFAKAIAMMKRNFKAVAFQYINQELFSKTTDSTVRKRVLNDVAHADTTIAVAAMEQGNDFDEAAKLREAKIKLYLINSDVQATDTTGLAKNKIPYLVLNIHGTGHFPMIEDTHDFNMLLGEAIADIKTTKRE